MSQETLTQEDLQKISFEPNEKVHIFSKNFNWSAMSEIADKAKKQNVKISFSVEEKPDNKEKCDRIFHIM